jgi:hypothetical protein
MVGECAHSGIGLMRYVAAKDGDRAHDWLERHVKRLSARRDGTGRWKGLPFYYTLLALSEIDLPAARQELGYAVPACERVLKRRSRADSTARRRRGIVHRALSRCA